MWPALAKSQGVKFGNALQLNSFNENKTSFTQEKLCNILTSVFYYS